MYFTLSDMVCSNINTWSPVIDKERIDMVLKTIVMLISLKKLCYHMKGWLISIAEYTEWTLVTYRGVTLSF